jgi:hypothetical protein
MALLLVSGCAGCSTVSFESPLPVEAEPALEQQGLRRSAVLQRTLEAESDALREAFSQLHDSGEWEERGYFSAGEHDTIEGLLFRFVVNHAAFWGELDRRGGSEMLLVSEAEKPRAHVLALHAGLSLGDSSAFLVAEFKDDPIAIAKLNEAFYRSEIPRGTYDLLRRASMSETRRHSLLEAWSLHQQALAQPDSEVSQVAADDPDFAPLIEALPRLYARATKNLDSVFPLDASRLQAMRRSAQLSDAADLGRASRQGLAEAGYATRSLVFKDVSRIKSPTADIIGFSDEQKRQIHAALQPGDILLSYTAGYVSSVFIPGEFKHGMTYVGGTEERTRAGLEPESIPALASAERSRFEANLATEVTSNGRPADLIEAVAEGVKFSNLEQILDTHINRLLVLRPRLGDAELVEFLAGVFAYLGDPYDFRFDFADASRQVCTEVIYRAIQGRAGITFELTSRGGHPTLSADDIVLYHLAAEVPRFDFILYAAEDPDRDDRRARVWVGEAGEQVLRELMGREDSDAPVASDT